MVGVTSLDFGIHFLWICQELHTLLDVLLFNHLASCTHRWEHQLQSHRQLLGPRASYESPLCTTEHTAVPTALHLPCVPVAPSAHNLVHFSDRAALAGVRPSTLQGCKIPKGEKLFFSCTKHVLFSLCFLPAHCLPKTTHQDKPQWSVTM